MNWKRLIFSTLVGLLIGSFCAVGHGALTQSITAEPNAYWWTGNIYDDDAWTWAKEVETILEAWTMGDESNDIITFPTNGLTIDNATDNALEINENSDELILTFGSNTVTMSSGDVTLFDVGTVVLGFDQFKVNATTYTFPTSDGTSGQVLQTNSSGTLSWAANAGGITDLDTAYDGGSTIDVDTAALTFTVSTTDNNAVMVLAQNDASQATDPNGLEIDMVATSNGTALDIDGNSTGYDIKGTGDLWTVDGAGALTAVSATIPTITCATTLTASSGITLGSGDTVKNTVDTEFLFTDTGGENFSIDMAAAANAIGLKSGSGVDELQFGAIDDLTGIGTIAFDAAASTITLTSAGDAQDLTIAVAGSNNVTLALTSTGTAADAMTFATSAGGMDITVAGAASDEDMDLLSNRAINLTSTEATVDSIAIQSSGGFDFDAVDDIIMTLVASADADDFRLIQTGAHNVSISLETTGTGADAINLAASVGGITATVPSGKTIAMGATAGSHITMGNATADWDILTDNASFTLTDAADDAFQIINAAGPVLLDIDLGGADGIDFGDASCIMALVSSDWTINATGVVANLASIGFDANSSPTITVVGDGADTFTISQTGNADNNLVIDAQGTAADALTLQTSVQTGGITIISASGAIEFSDDNLTSVGDIECDDITKDGDADLHIGTTKTVIKTIDCVPAGTTDDFSFDADANANEQTEDLGALIPAYAEIVSVQIRCFEATSGGVTMSVDIGVTTGAGDILAACAPDALNEVFGGAANSAPIIGVTNAARNVWVNATPSANWDTLTTGRYAVMVTYLDYGAVYTHDGP